MGKKFISTEDFWKPPPPPPKPKATGGWSTVVRPDAEDRDVIIDRLMTYDETTIKYGIFREFFYILFIFFFYFCIYYFVIFFCFWIFILFYIFIILL